MYFTGRWERSLATASRLKQLTSVPTQEMRVNRSSLLPRLQRHPQIFRDFKVEHSRMLLAIPLIL